MTYNDEEAGVAGEDDSIILRKYFGVKDKSALKELYTSTSSDASFYKLAEKIERKSLGSSKTVKHRVECWLRKLCQQTSNYDWKKNRNHYAILLLDMLEKGRLTFPFDKRPDEGPLKTLPSYLRPFSSKYREEAFRPQLKESSNKQEDIVNIASAAVDVLHEHNRSRSVVSAVDSSNGFRYDAEIQLGACRERCLELEMQVSSRNDHIARLESQIVSMRKAHRKETQKYKDQLKSLQGTFAKNLGEIIKRYTLHFRNSRPQNTAAPPDDDVSNASKSRDDREEYIMFLQKFKDQMQLMKKTLLETVE